MASDVLLEDHNKIILQGDAVVSGPDIFLDNEDRRQTSGGRRRALVHNTDDGLTINFRGDYPGGTSCEGSLRVAEMNVVGEAEFLRAPRVPDLLVSGLHTGRPVSGGVSEVSLVETIQELKAEIEALRQQVLDLA